MTNTELEKALERAQREINYWRNLYLEFPCSKDEEDLNDFFHSISGDDIIFHGPDKCYKSAVKEYFKMKRDKE